MSRSGSFAGSCGLFFALPGPRPGKTVAPCPSFVSPLSSCCTGTLALFLFQGLCSGLLVRADLYAFLFGRLNLIPNCLWDPSGKHYSSLYMIALFWMCEEQHAQVASILLALRGVAVATLSACV